MGCPLATRLIDAAERRARLGRRHFLAAPAGDVEAAAGGVVGLHSSDPATVYLSAWARVSGFEAADLERALYDRRSLVRMLGMRKTIFVLPVDQAAVMEEACTRAYAAPERRRLAKVLADQGVAGEPEAWIDRVSGAVLAALDEVGEATGAELRTHVPELTETIEYAVGKPYGGTAALTTRIVFLLAADGKIVRGRPRGSWLSSQYRWVTVERWLDGGLPPVDPGEAPAALVRSYLACYGPATFTDVKWWTGWTVAKTRLALATVGAVEVGLEDGLGYVLPDDVEPVSPPEPWVALVPGLDPAVMGWKERLWILGPHEAQLFDRNGNVGPTIWVGGRVVGGWAVGPTGAVRTELLEDVGSEAEPAVAARAAELTAWLDGTKVTPRFRTPLEKELAER